MQNTTGILPLSNATPENVSSTPSSGTALNASRADHTHSIQNNTITKDMLTNTLKNCIHNAVRHIGYHTGGSANNTSNETTLAYVTIPANTITTFIRIYAVVYAVDTINSGSDAFTLTYRIKTGPTGSETTKKSYPSTAYTYDARYPIRYYQDLKYIDDSLNWNTENTVKITAQMNLAATYASSYCDYLIVDGI